MKQIIIKRCLECHQCTVGTIEHSDYGWVSTFYCQSLNEYVGPDSIHPNCPLDNMEPEDE